MKCPVCGGQIEGVTKFHCAFSKNHYQLRIDDEIVPFRIIHETVQVIDGHKQYRVYQSENETEIYVSQLNGDYEIIPPDKTKPAPKSIKFDKKIFNFLQTNREKLLTRIKTILVFS
jgi:hypothetical protein